MESHPKNENHKEELNSHFRRIMISRLAIIYFILLIFAFSIIISLIINENDEIFILTAQNKNRFFETVDKAIFTNDSLMLNIESIRMIYNSIDREMNGLLFKYGFINLLEDYLVRNSLDSSSMKIQNNHKIFELIRNELKLEPYSILTSEQRRLLTNLDRSIIQGDSILAKFNLVELNDLLRIQNEKIEKLEYKNSWSIPLGFTGAFLTIIFGFITLLKPNSIINIEKIIERFMDKTQKNTN